MGCQDVPSPRGVRGGVGGGWRGPFICPPELLLRRLELLPFANICCPLCFRMAGIGTKEGRKA
jgi:hypothetical protein